jgi:outer membrane protein assembly factor BamB
MVMGATPTEAFGLEERSGKVVWSTPLAEAGTEIGMTPGYYNGYAYFGTQPAGQTDAGGVLWGLDVRSGVKRLRFEPGKKKGAGLGRGLTGLPAFDFKGSVYMGSGSPGPSSIFKFDEGNGKLESNHRLAPARPGAGTWDPVIAELGEKKIVVVADRSGKVVALDRSGKLLWQHFSGSAVVGPIAVSGETVFVPTGDGRQGFLVALSLANGTMQWKHGFQTSLAGPVLATNDLVFATAADGRVYAFGAKSGKKLWSDKPSSAAEGGLAIGSRTLLVRVGTPESDPGPELVAYRLPAKPPKPSSVADPGRDAAG